MGEPVLMSREEDFLVFPFRVELYFMKGGVHLVDCMRVRGGVDQHSLGRLGHPPFKLGLLYEEAVSVVDISQHDGLEDARRMGAAVLIDGMYQGHRTRVSCDIFRVS